MSWPSAYGGQDAPVLKQLVYNEEMAYAGAPGQTMGADRFGPTLILYGTDEQKAEHLPQHPRAARCTWCQGFSEPGSGSDLASLQTRAVRDGDDYVDQRPEDLDLRRAVRATGCSCSRAPTPTRRSTAASATSCST